MVVGGTEVAKAVAKSKQLSNKWQKNNGRIWLANVCPKQQAATTMKAMVLADAYNIDADKKQSRICSCN